MPLEMRYDDQAGGWVYAAPPAQAGYAPGSIQPITGPDGMHYAVNPRTGQQEPLFMDNDTSRLYFQSDGNMPATAQQGGAATYHSDSGFNTFDELMSRAIPIGGLAALAAGGGGFLESGAAGAGGGTGAATPAISASGGTLADTLAANAAGGLKVAPEAASLSSAISGASGATGASGVIPGVATENAITGLGGGLSVPGVTGAGSTGAIGAAGAGLGLGYAGGAAAGGATGSATGGAAAAGGTALGTAGTAAAAGAGGIGATTLGKIISGDVGLGDLADSATLGDLSRVLGTGLATAGSIAADTARTDAQKEMYNTYLGLGAPSRARYEASFAPGFDVNSIPGFTNALDTSAQAVTRKLSAAGGANPFGNPGQLTEAMNYLSGNLALPALNTYRNQNAATGGFGAFSTAAPGVGAAAIDSGSAAYTDLARGASDIFNPPTDLARLLSKYQGAATMPRGVI